MIFHLSQTSSYCVICIHICWGENLVTQLALFPSLKRSWVQNHLLACVKFLCSPRACRGSLHDLWLTQLFVGALFLLAVCWLVSPCSNTN